MYFKSSFSDATTKNYNAQRKKRIDFLCNNYQDSGQEHYEESYKAIQKEVLQYEKPNSWNIHAQNNMETTLEVDFKVFAIQVAKEVAIPVDKIDVFTFYASVELIKKKSKSNEQQHNNKLQRISKR